MEKTVVKSICCLVSIILGNIYLPIIAFFVQWWNYIGIAQDVDTFVHAQYRLRVPGHHNVQFPMISSETECLIILQDEHKWCHLFHQGRFDSVQDEHSVNLFFPEFSLRSAVLDMRLSVHVSYPSCCLLHCLAKPRWPCYMLPNCFSM